MESCRPDMQNCTMVSRLRFVSFFEVPNNMDRPFARASLLHFELLESLALRASCSGCVCVEGGISISSDLVPDPVWVWLYWDSGSATGLIADPKVGGEN